MASYSIDDGRVSHEPRIDTVNTDLQNNVLYMRTLGRVDSFSPADVLRSRCCANCCNIEVTSQDILDVRCEIFTLVDRPDMAGKSREDLSMHDFIRSYLSGRVAIPVKVDADGLPSIRFNATIGGIKVCRSLFLRVIGIDEEELAGMIRRMQVDFQKCFALCKDDLHGEDLDAKFDAICRCFAAMGCP